MAVMSVVSTIDKFIPELWSPRLKHNMNARLIYGDRVNRDYEGEISGSGDTVHVNSIQAVALTAYDRNGSLAAPITLADGVVDLKITQADAFNFKIDDIDKAQTKGAVMEEAMKEAGFAMANSVDKYIAGLYTEATAGAPLAAAATTNKDKMYELLVGNRQKFQELNVPIDELSVIVSPWMESNLLLDPRFIHATASGDNVLRTGEIGRMAGFTIYVSNNVAISTVTTNNIMSFAGKGGITFADKLNKVEAYRPQLMFADAVKGLHVYGAKTIEPKRVITNAVVNA